MQNYLTFSLIKMLEALRQEVRAASRRRDQSPEEADYHEHQADLAALNAVQSAQAALNTAERSR